MNERMKRVIEEAIKNPPQKLRDLPDILEGFEKIVDWLNLVCGGVEIGPESKKYIVRAKLFARDPKLVMSQFYKILNPYVKFMKGDVKVLDGGALQFTVEFDTSFTKE